MNPWNLANQKFEISQHELSSQNFKSQIQTLSTIGLKYLV
jgi:hypothetical protein